MPRHCSVSSRISDRTCWPHIKDHARSEASRRLWRRTPLQLQQRGIKWRPARVIQPAVYLPAEILLARLTGFLLCRMAHQCQESRTIKTLTAVRVCGPSVLIGSMTYVVFRPVALRRVDLSIPPPTYAYWKTLTAVRVCCERETGESFSEATTNDFEVPSTLENFTSYRYRRLFPRCNLPGAQ